MEAGGTHVSRGQLELMAKGRLPPQERRRIVGHLLSGCEPCLDLARLSLFPLDEPDYTGLLRRLELALVVAENDVQEERRHAAELWPVLEPLPPERRLFVVKHDSRFHRWGVYEKTLQEAKARSRHDPLQAVDLAHMALALTELLDPESYGDERIADFRAGCCATLGNAKRLMGDLDGAGAALRAAEDHLKEGTGDPIERINVISIRSSLTTDLGYLEEAKAMLDPALRLAQKIRDRHLEGRLTFQQSSSIGYVDPALGLELAEKGLTLIDKESEPQLELVGRHLLAFWTNETGDPGEAKAIVDTYRYLYARNTDPFWTGRLLHLEANIARTEEDLRTAELLFRDLVSLYSEHHFDFDLALASLDLAEVLTSQGRHDESAEILAALDPVLAAWRLNGDILRSWTILLHGARDQVIGRATFREVAMILRRLWYQR